ncbi:hypothetical protein DSCO28_70970 [Desulfosarcina ovata subsp. sediminis]|uniref:PEP-CTERM protein-sorting domain-containing protein n=1 Tax=Desulfosarcina ovata subsp. sediminis TaxID=885957 RepID=A0A5K8A261_9BACT|nr:VPLPA-CTERM sorting domain-containing protein [Desulfosarcina ovata]BBO86531.1 hypothetical protein DSCO28_70970 [Desulfosarcina ovata subsp. sediminis]
MASTSDPYAYWGGWNSDENNWDSNSGWDFNTAGITAELLADGQLEGSADSCRFFRHRDHGRCAVCGCRRIRIYRLLPFLQLAAPITLWNGESLSVLSGLTLSDFSLSAFNGVSADNNQSDDIGGAGSITAWTSAEVKPVPIPGAIWLLGSGLLGLAGVRRKVKS